MDKELLRQSVRNILLMGLSPTRAFEILEGAVLPLPLDEAIREVVKELAEQNIIYWEMDK
jgi:phage baseplate assembly protein W